MSRPELIQDIENKIDKTQIKNILTETTTGNVLDARQGKALNDKIVALQGLQNGFQIYKSVTELGLESTATWAEIATAMKPNSILITQECGDVKPTSWGTVTVKKSINNNRVEFMWTESVKGSSPTRTYIAHHHTDGGFSGWKQIATTLDIDKLKSTTLPSNKDFNSLIENGRYYCNGFANSPDGTSSQWYVEVITLQDGVNILQIAYRRTNLISTVVYFRSSFNGVWNEWSCLSNGVPCENITDGQDLNKLTKIGVYTCVSVGTTATLLNRPTQDSGYVELEVKSVRALSNTWLSQTYTLRTTSTSPCIFERVTYDSGVTWKNWYEISTTEKTEILSSELLNGYQVIDSSRDEIVVCKSGNVVNITGRIKNTAGTINGYTIFTLPREYRPSKYRRTFSSNEGTGTIVKCEVKPAGEVVIYDTTVQANQGIRLNITYSI